MNLDFGKAIQALKEGSKVSRQGWNGKGMYLQIGKGLLPCETLTGTSGVDLKSMQADKDGIITHVEGVPIALFDGDEVGEATVLPCVQMKTVLGSIVNGWLASQTDMLAEDWGIVE